MSNMELSQRRGVPKLLRPTDVSEPAKGRSPRALEEGRGQEGARNSMFSAGVVRASRSQRSGQLFPVCCVAVVLVFTILGSITVGLSQVDQGVETEEQRLAAGAAGRHGAERVQSARRRYHLLKNGADDGNGPPSDHTTGAVHKSIGGSDGEHVSARAPIVGGYIDLSRYFPPRDTNGTSHNATGDRTGRGATDAWRIFQHTAVDVFLVSSTPSGSTTTGSGDAIGNAELVQEWFAARQKGAETTTSTGSSSHHPNNRTLSPFWLPQAQLRIRSVQRLTSSYDEVSGMNMSDWDVLALVVDVNSAAFQQYLGRHVFVSRGGEEKIRRLNGSSTTSGGAAVEHAESLSPSYSPLLLRFLAALDELAKFYFRELRRSAHHESEILHKNGSVVRSDNHTDAEATFDVVVASCSELAAYDIKPLAVSGDLFIWPWERRRGTRTPRRNSKLMSSLPSGKPIPRNSVPTVGPHCTLLPLPALGEVVHEIQRRFSFISTDTTRTDTRTSRSQRPSGPLPSGSTTSSSSAMIPREELCRLLDEWEEFRELADRALVLLAQSIENRYGTQTISGMGDDATYQRVSRARRKGESLHQWLRYVDATQHDSDGDQGSEQEELDIGRRKSGAGRKTKSAKDCYSSFLEVQRDPVSPAFGDAMLRAASKYGELKGLSEKVTPKPRESGRIRDRVVTKMKKANWAGDRTPRLSRAEVEFLNDMRRDLISMTASLVASLRQRQRTLEKKVLDFYREKLSVTSAGDTDTHQQQSAKENGFTGTTWKNADVLRFAVGISLLARSRKVVANSTDNGRQYTLSRRKKRIEEIGIVPLRALFFDEDIITPKPPSNNSAPPAAGAAAVTTKSSSNARSSTLLEDDISIALDLSVDTAPKVPYTLVWTAYCCRCCGFSTEIEHLVLPLEAKGGIPLVTDLGQECFCPTASHRRAELQRLHVPPLLLEETLSPGENADANDFRVVVFHIQPDRYDFELFNSKTTVYIGRSMYEFSQPPKTWLSPLKRLHYVWVPSTFVQESFAAEGVPREKIRIIPEAIDVHRWSPGDGADESESSTATARTVPWKKKDLAVRLEELTQLIRNQVPASVFDSRDFAALRSPSLASTRDTSLAKLDLSSHTHVFFSHFKWEDRKGWPVLFEAFWREFSPPLKSIRNKQLPQENGPSDRPLLLVLTHGSFIPSVEDRARERHDPNRLEDQRFNVSLLLTEFEQWIAGESEMAGLFWEQHDSSASALGDNQRMDWTKVFNFLPRVVIVSTHLNDKELVNLYRSADVFVLPSRGEGWGLPVVQAMSCALPVIVTHFSGMVDYTSNETAFLVHVDQLEPVPNTVIGTEYAVVDPERVRAQMRRVVAEPAEALQRAAAARRFVVKHLSEEAVVEVLYKTLLEIEVPRPQATLRSFFRRLYMKFKG